MKLLIGGSPCTHWSIAQTKNRETKAEGIGWELFRNYVIARNKYQPDYFLYENNKSMSTAIREQITAELGVEPVLINSALVSAQNRQRLYWAGRRNPDGTYSQVPVEQPEDRGILLRDILESGVCWREKGYTLKANYFKSSVTSAMDGGHFPAPMAAEPVNMTADGKAQCLRATCYKDGIRNLVGNTVDRKTCVAVPVRVGAMPNKDGELGTSQSRRIYSTDGKQMPAYEVRGGRITIKGKTYPIKLADGFYIIRKLTVTECKRLQTVPDSYVFPVSDTQAYKMLGNGWTVDVIAHILSHFEGLTAEPVEVLSMYDGMSCGHIALDKLGGHIERYYATEIDKYAIATTQHNYPDTIQLGDAFQVRALDWELPRKEEHT